MRYSVTLLDKCIQVELSNSAEKVLGQRVKPIIADINLIFGCLVVKRVWFKEQSDDETVAVTNKLRLCFNVVRYTKSCCIADIDAGAESEDFPLGIAKNCFVPSHLFIDHNNGGFSGNCVYDHSPGLN